MFLNMRSQCGIIYPWKRYSCKSFRFWLTARSTMCPVRAADRAGRRQGGWETVTYAEGSGPSLGLSLREEPLISVLIPNRDHSQDLRRCIDSLRHTNTWKRLEILKRDPDAQIVKGHVHFRHRGATLMCDSAYFYQTTNSVRAMGHVHRPGRKNAGLSSRF